MKVIEKNIEDYFIRKCEQNHMWTTKFISASRSGVPDRVVIYNGITIFVELKKPGEKPRPLQVEIHKKMRKYGALIEVLSTFDEVDVFIENLIRRGKK